MATIDDVKMRMRVVTTAYDSEISGLIEAAKKDLEIAGIFEPDESDELCLQAIATYCKMNFGLPEDYDKLKRSYDEQKAQLMVATGYTDWGASDV